MDETKKIVKKISKKPKVNNKTISIVLLTSAVWALCISGLGFINQYTNVKTISFDFAKQNSNIYVTSRSINSGEIIKDNDLILKEVNSTETIPGGIIDYKHLVGQQAMHQLYENQQLTPSDVIAPQIVKDDLITYAVPINLSVLHDSNIKLTDYVDVVINYTEKEAKTRKDSKGKAEKYNVNKPTETIASKVIITNIIDGKGNKIINSDLQTGDSKQQAAFISVLVKKSLLANLDDAKKRGSLNLIKYLDLNKDPAAENYKPSWLN